jgi:hypothetical protein
MRVTVFQLRVNQTSRYRLDDIQLKIGSETPMFSIDYHQDSQQR